MWAEGGHFTDLKRYINWLISLLGLGGMLHAIFAKDRRFLPVILTLGTVLPYAFVQPTLRYRYLIFSLLVYFCAYFISQTMKSRWLRSHGTARQIFWYQYLKP